MNNIDDMWIKDILYQKDFIISILINDSEIFLINDTSEYVIKI